MINATSQNTETSGNIMLSKFARDVQCYASENQWKQPVNKFDTFGDTIIIIVFSLIALHNQNKSRTQESEESKYHSVWL